MKENMLNAFLIELDESKKVEIVLSNMKIVDIVTKEQAVALFDYIQMEETDRLINLRRPKLSRMADIYLGEIVAIECAMNGIEYASNALQLNVLEFLNKYKKYIAYVGASETIHQKIIEIENSSVVLS